MRSYIICSFINSRIIQRMEVFLKFYLKSRNMIVKMERNLYTESWISLLAKIVLHKERGAKE